MNSRIFHPLLDLIKVELLKILYCLIEMTTVSQPGSYIGIKNKHQTEQFTLDDPNEKFRMEASMMIEKHPMNLSSAAMCNGTSFADDRAR